MNRKGSLSGEWLFGGLPSYQLLDTVDGAIDFEWRSRRILIESPLLFLDHQDILADQIGQQFLGHVAQHALH
jgi:hypothetical protein